MDFFKVYLSAISSNQLTLPKSFTMLIDGSIPKGCTLEDHKAITWPIRVEKVEEDLVFTDGWNEFVKHHSLVDANFLIFKFDGRSHFDVEIYARNGLKIQSCCVNDHTPLSRVKEEPQLVETEMKQNTKAAPKPISKPAQKPRSSAPARSQQIEPLDIELPKGPRWIKKIVRETQYRLYIPRSELQKYKIKLTKEIDLVDEEDKMWPARIKVMSDHRQYVTHGWAEFREKHRMQFGSWCVCEFMLEGDNNVCNAIKVRALRKPRN